MNSKRVREISVSVLIGCERVAEKLMFISTGIGPGPLVAHLREKFPTEQANRRALLTDDHLTLKGSSNIWSPAYTYSFVSLLY